MQRPRTMTSGGGRPYESQATEARDNTTTKHSTTTSVIERRQELDITLPSASLERWRPTPQTCTFMHLSALFCCEIYGVMNMDAHLLKGIPSRPPLFFPDLSRT